MTPARLILLIVVLHACAVGLAAAEQRADGAEFADTVRTFDVEESTVSRFYNLPWADACNARRAQMYAAWQVTLAAADFDALGEAGRIDWLLLRTQLTYELAKLAEDRARLAQLADLLPFRTPVADLLMARWHHEQVDQAAAAATLAAIPDQVRRIRARLELGHKVADKDAAAEHPPADGVKVDEAVPLPITPLLALRATQTIAAMREATKAWYEAYDGAQPGFSWWMKSPYEQSEKALDEFVKYLREDCAGLKGKDEDPLLGEALGAAGLARDLAKEFLPYTPDELLAIGEREFAWCEARMREAAKAMGCADDWHAALERVKADSAPPGAQDAYIASQAVEAIAFVTQRDLVTVPPLCAETWRIKLITSDAQRLTPYVAYDGMNVLAAYAREDMSNADKLMSMRGNNRHFTRLTTAHELIPGHHLQSWYAQRFRAYRGEFTTPFLVEGWALYWEMALWDLGYARSPEDQVGMLFWRMHRAARIIVTLKFHLGRMTPAQMVDFLVERVGHERFGATSEVRRYIGGDYAPLYQCGYMVGGLQLRALAKELTATGMTTKQVNDAVLHCGTIPVELIRASLRGLPLGRETRAAWRFDD
ncbi:MAG: DUF885 family protein [Planctomycetes bacterium]|nr:DUF885 family protein [Planctomycetota bacterium]